MKVIIIGGVAAGMSAAMKLKRNLGDKVEVVVYEKSSTPSFSNCGLAYGISNKYKTDDLYPKNLDNFISQGINVHVYSEVKEIDNKNKRIKIQNLKTKKITHDTYDKLIVTTGASALKLPIPGLDKEINKYSLRTLDDMFLIKENISKAKNVLIIGGGFIGVELAENIKLLKKNVTLVESNPYLTKLDFDFSSFVEQELRDNGVNLFVKKTIHEIDWKSKHAILSNSKKIKYDLIITTGISPNTKILIDANAKKYNNNLIKTNKYMQTSLKNVYAAGDIVMTPHVLTNKLVYAPFAKNAKTQGKVIADHISKDKSNKQHKTTGAFVYPIFSNTVAKTGLTERAVRKLRIPYRVVMCTTSSNANYANAQKLTMKMIYNSKSKRLLGLQAFGKYADKKIDVFTALLSKKATIYDLEKLQFAYHPKYNSTLDPLNVIANLAIKELKEGFESICPLDIKKDDFIIDIRSPKQHKEKGFIEHAINIPANEISLNKLPVDKNSKIIVHCNTGFGATNVAISLLKMGFKNVKNVYGGNEMYQRIIKSDKKD